jgi:hypothetical protein
MKAAFILILTFNGTTAERFKMICPTWDCVGIVRSEMIGDRYLSRLQVWREEEYTGVGSPMIGFPASATTPVLDEVYQ